MARRTGKEGLHERVKQPKPKYSPSVPWPYTLQELIDEGYVDNGPERGQPGHYEEEDWDLLEYPCNCTYCRNPTS